MKGKSRAGEEPDKRLRVVSVALEPALVLARALAIPLDDLLTAVSVGYFRVHHDRGLSFTTIARRLGKSRRTIANLASLSKTHGGDAESELISLRRRIIERLASEGVVDEQKFTRRWARSLGQHLNEELEVLIATGVIERTRGQLRVAAPFLSLVGPDLEQRLASLQQFMLAVAHGIYQRFFGSPSQTESFARVLSFRASRARLRGITNDCYRDLREAVLLADREVEREPEQGRSCALVLLATEEPTGPGFG